MPFSEKVKLESKKKSAFRCCICHKPFVEVHHIVPQSEGGPDTISNAATLCSSCHDLYGGNPEKRKIIRQMRDHWWELMSQRKLALARSEEFDDICVIEEDPNYEGHLKSKSIALYHLVFSHEGFETAATHLFELAKNAQKHCPNQNRILFLDIEGHRNEKQAFDHDMFELQTDFILGVLAPFLKEVYMPLNHIKNPRTQNNDFPDEIRIVNE